MAVHRVVQKSTARLKILHSGKANQKLTVINFFTLIDSRKNLKQNDILGEDTYKVEVVKKQYILKEMSVSSASKTTCEPPAIFR